MRCTIKLSSQRAGIRYGSSAADSALADAVSEVVSADSSHGLEVVPAPSHR